MAVSGPCKPISPAHGVTPVVDHSMREAEELRRKVVQRKEDHDLAKLLEAKGSFAEAEALQSGCVVAWGASAWRGG